MKKKTIGIVGYGFVGKAVAQLSEVYDVRIYDPNISGYDNREQKMAAYLSDIVFVCVPTPRSPDGLLDCSIVESCVKAWSWYGRRNLENKSLLVIKSTVEPMMTENLSIGYNTDKILYNPEFLTQRTAMEDFRQPVEIIIGGKPEYAEVVTEMYKGYYLPNDNEPQYHIVSSRMAEMVKMTRNSFYALKVTFFNEISEICQKMDINYDDFRDVFTLKGNHPWITKQHTQVPGPDGKVGFGGACLPKDSEGLVELAEHFEVDLTTLKAALESNNRRRNNEIK